MKKQICAIALLLSMSLTSAQVKKCVGADGKVTFSDTVCSSSAVKTSDVKIFENTIDTSEMRRAGENLKNREIVGHEEREKQNSGTQSQAVNSYAAEQAIRQGADTCKFEAYVYGDSKGKTLAQAAKQECLNNLGAKATGQPTSNDAYTRWRDHRMLSKRTVCTGNSQFSGTATPRGSGVSVEGTSTGTAVCR